MNRAALTVLVGLSALAGQAVVVSSGRTISGWTVDAKGWWHASVEPGTKSTQFFVNRQRRTRPHLPRQGYFKMAKNRSFGEEWNHRFTARGGYPGGARSRRRGGVHVPPLADAAPSRDGLRRRAPLDPHLRAAHPERRLSL